MAKHADSTTPAASAPRFTDNRVKLLRSNDKNCASFWEIDQAGFESDEDGPVHLIIGRLAPDAALGRMAARFGLDVEDLKAFRDAPEGEVSHG